MYTSFHNFFIDRYKNIDLKIKKRKYKLKKIKQNGGGNQIADALVEQIDRLESIKSELGSSILLVNKTGFEEINAKLNEVTTNINSAISELKAKEQIIPSDTSIEKFKNSLQLFESQILSEGEGYHTINITPKQVVITTPIPEQFKIISTEFIKNIDSEILKFSQQIEQRDKSDEAGFKALNTNIQEKIQSIKTETAKIDGYIKIIDKQIQSINRYTNKEFTLMNDKYEYFIAPDDAQEDLITLRQLSTISQITPSSSREQIDQRMKELQFTIQPISGDQLIDPDILKGGAITYYYENDKLKIIVFEIYNKWVEIIKENFKERERLKRAELRRLEEEFESNKAVINPKLEELKSQTESFIEKLRIFKIKFENLSSTIPQDKINLIDNLKTINNTFNTILEEINIFLQLELTPDTFIYIKNKVDTYLQIIKYNILEINKINFVEEKTTIIEELKNDAPGLGGFFNIIKQNPNLLNIFMLVLYKDLNIKYYNKTNINIEDINKYIEENKININVILNDFKKLIGTNNNKSYDNETQYKNDNIYIYIIQNDMIKTYNKDKKYKEFNFVMRNYNIYFKSSTKDGGDLNYNQSRDKLTKYIDNYNTNHEKIKQNEKIIATLNSLNFDKKYIKYQSGGVFNEWIIYSKNLNELQANISSYKIKYNDFYKKVNEFNLLYIDLYHHQLYISSYIGLYLISNDYRVYQYISKGMIDYYLKGIRKIKQLINENNSDGSIQYFKKYHMINIKILEQFLKILYENWKIVYTFTSVKQDDSEKKQEIEQNKNISKLSLMDPNIIDDNFKFCIFLFNIFKNLIDSYLSLNKAPVAAFLRINDFNKIDDSVLIFKKIENKDMFDYNSLLKCDTIKNTNDVKDKTPLEDITNIGNYINNLKEMKFENIFDTSFNSNETLALYMGIPNFLSMGKSILLITYGYSGVGKTFTIFGNKKDNLKGLLQKALETIKNKLGIKLRTFELYGTALPYKSYWVNSKHNHALFSYPYNSNEISPIKIEPLGFDNYINDINEEYNSLKTYADIDMKDINSISEFIDKIDKIRITTGRIKKTVNNPVSSRSIMIYDFKIKLENSSDVSFVIMDLPGKEDVMGTYVKNNNDKKQQEYGIKIKPIGLLQGNNSNETYLPLRTAVFLNPIFISAFPPLSVMFNDFVVPRIYKDPTYNDKIVKLLNVPTYTLKEIVNNENINEIIPVKNNDGRITLTNEQNKNYNYSFKSIEILKYLISKNEIQILIDFYNDQLLELTPDQKTQNYGALPFEAFYINENILDIVALLRKYKIDKTDKVITTKDFFNVNVNMTNSKPTGYENIESIDESTSQGYFMRKLIQKLSQTTILNDIDKQFKPYGQSSDLTIKQWMTNMYKFNESFVDNSDNSPIYKILKPYIQKIDNIYLFYVVNNNASYKCINQIKLINDSKDFVDAINNYKPPKKD